MTAGPGFIGARIVKDNVGGIKEAIRSQVSEAIERGAWRVLMSAKEYCPVDTGDLKASGEVIQHGRLSFSVRFGEGLPDARAIYQEYGTSRHGAQPYLTPALDDETVSICEEVAQVIQGRVRHTDVRIEQTAHMEEWE